MSVEFAIERFDDVFIAEVKPLLERHWQELARNKEDIKLDPDYEMYKRLDEIGCLVVMTARKARQLIGYAAYFIRPHHHYKSAQWAVSDLLIIMPEHRSGRVGLRMIKFIEQELVRRNVKVMHTTEKIAHPALGRLLASQGHVAIETGYAKKLG